MSASRKKMLRREENVAAMTERQQSEMKEAKKLRAYTAIFTVVILLMVAVVIGTSVVESGIIERNTVAATVGGNDISAVEMNYFYTDNVNNYVSQYGDYISMFGLDTTLPLDEQYFDQEAGETWADYFLEMTTTNLQRTYALYNAAQAAGYTLPEDVMSEIDANIDSMDLYATLYGLTSGDGYVKAMYGAGSNKASLKDYMIVQYTAQYFYNETLEGMTYTNEELRAAEAENYDAFSSFTYDYYYLPVSSFYEGGITDEETGTTTYSDEEKAAGEQNCLDMAEILAKQNTLEELNAMIAALAEEKGLGSSATIAMENALYSGIDAKTVEWLTAEERQAGDIGYVKSTSTSTDADGNEVETLNGCYVIHYVGKSENTDPLVNVRHVLVQFEGGTTDETTGATTYSDEEKAAAQAEAEELLAAFTSGEATEESFATMANENSDDTGSNTTGGLYENVYPNQMVKAFNDWCFDAARQPGDIDIVETEYGYHIIYFVGQSDTNYRDYMISNSLRETDITEWETGLVEATEVTTVDLSKLNTGLTLSTSEA